jgi:hypothetical protein
MSMPSTYHKDMSILKHKIDMSWEYVDPIDMFGEHVDFKS